MFADSLLARRIEAAEASLTADLVEAVIRRGAVAGAFSRTLAGGVAAYAGADSPVTKVIGIGLDGVPGDDRLRALEADYFARDAAVRFEVATLADPTFLQQLTRGGYVLNGFENVLAYPLSALGEGEAPRSGVSIDAPDDRQAWMDVLIDGFSSPDLGVVSAPGETFDRQAVERVFGDIAGVRGFRSYVSSVAGRAAGAASMRIFEGVAQLSGAATLPAYRRRGVHTAMLHFRLHEAARAGCDLAVVTTEPGSRSQQNVQRAGFSLLYSRAVLIKRPVDPQS